MAGSQSLPPLGPADHIRGRLQAPLIVVEYGDYECPFCAAAPRDVRALWERYAKRLSSGRRSLEATSS